MAFNCDKCGFKNNEIQSAGEIKEQGIKVMLRADKLDDLQRQIVKSESATLKIESLDLEAPPGPGRLSNVEGFLTNIREDLEKLQEQRREQQLDVYERIQDTTNKLQEMTEGKSFPIIVCIDDPAGNSQIEPSPHDGTGKYKVTHYNRTPQQNATLGLHTYPERTGSQTSAESPAADALIGTNGEVESEEDSDIVEGKPYIFPTPCPGCGKPAAINMTMINIPYFKQVIVSAVVCEHCGYRSNEVKTGGEIPEYGKRIWLDVKGPEDLKRDLLKAESCFLKVPDCQLEVQPGTMGGRFTTVEGLLTQVRDDLRGSIFEDVDDPSAGGGDSMPTAKKAAWDTFFAKLDKAINGEIAFTIELEDPLAGSYVQSYAAPEPDPQIRTEDYQRTAEEEEELGLADMRTELNADGEYVKEGVART